MPIPISNPFFQTISFSIILVLVLVVSLRTNRSVAFFPPRLTHEIKGLAVLMVIFAHIGYGIFHESNFLFPLSTLGGVGVNLFLLLSGYGVTISAMKQSDSIQHFYKKRLTKLYTPLWITLILLIAVDFLLLKTTHPLPEIINGFFGLFPKADISTSINSPLWYFTVIVFYYLLFPLVFFKKYPILSSIGIYLVTRVVLRLPLPIDHDVLTLYRVHDTAFPIGILLAAFVSSKNGSFCSTLENIKSNRFVNPLLMAVFLYGIWYTAIFSGVGKGAIQEQFIAMVTTLIVIFFFYLKKFEISFLYILGIFSYEIYLIHWPMIYRYDFLYPRFPAEIATTMYLGILIVAAFLLQKIATALLKKQEPSTKEKLENPDVNLFKRNF